jgi:hypothetical protein
MNDDIFYECIRREGDETIYHLVHEWKEIKTFFGIIHAYQCSNCGYLLNKKQFIKKNCRLHLDI